MALTNPMHYFTEQQLRDMDDMQQRWIGKIKEQEAELATLRASAEAAEAEAFDRGLCYAIGYLWDRGEGTIAEELWDTQFKTKRVPKYIYGYDAKKCRAMLRQKRTR